MKKLKSLTVILATILLAACSQSQSGAFSSSFFSKEDTSQTCGDMTKLSSEDDYSLSVSNTTQIISSSDYSTSDIEPEPSYYDGYYDSLVSWNNGEDLKNQLHAIIRNGYQALSYTKSSAANYDTNIHADHSKYDFEYLDVVYSNKDVYKSDTNKGWQREHAFCASLMCGSTTSNAVKFKGRATDFHNLLAASTNGNTSRGNKNYGYANAIMDSFVDRTSGLGYDGYSFDENTFEPANKDKGRLARAIFYMATMYKDDEQDTINNILMKGLQIVEDPVSYVAGNNCHFAIGHLSDLLEWNDYFDVDFLEMQHNVAVYSDTDNPDGYAQGNRNPYIDYPELVDYVYGDKKNEPGSLKDLVPSAKLLRITDQEISHYAIKEARREYSYEESIGDNDYQVVSVNYDFTYSDATIYTTHSLKNHVFSESDGDIINAKISTPINEIEYQIVLNPMATCSSGIINLTKDGIDNKTPGVEQSLIYDGVDFLFSFNTSYSAVSTNGVTLTNDNQKGGYTFGSTSRIITGLSLITKESYTIDKLFIKAMVGNASSSYVLTIKVGDVTVFTKNVNDNKDYKIFGGALNEPLTGQISFVFAGSSAIKLNSIAFNSIIA